MPCWPKSTTTIYFDDSTKLWHSRLGHVSLNSLQVLATQGLLEGVETCNLESCEHCVLGKETK